MVNYENKQISLTSLEFFGHQTLEDVLIEVDFGRLIALLDALLIVVLNQLGFQVLGPYSIEHIEEELSGWEDSFLQIVVR